MEHFLDSVAKVLARFLAEHADAQAVVVPRLARRVERLARDADKTPDEIFRLAQAVAVGFGANARLAEAADGEKVFAPLVRVVAELLDDAPKAIAVAIQAKPDTPGQRAADAGKAHRAEVLHLSSPRSDDRRGAAIACCAGLIVLVAPGPRPADICRRNQERFYEHVPGRPSGTRRDEVRLG